MQTQSPQHPAATDPESRDLPAFYIVLASIVCVILLIAEKTQARTVSGLVLVGLGIPVYYLWRRVARS